MKKEYRKISEIRKDMADEKKNFDSLRSAGEKEMDVEALDASRKKLKTLQTELKDAELAESVEKSQANDKLTKSEIAEAKRFSITKFIREEADPNAKLTGVEKKMADIAAAEAKAAGFNLKGAGIPSRVLKYNRAAQQTVGDAAAGGNLVQEEPLEYVEALRKKLVLTSLGAKFLTGLVGNLPIVKGGSFLAEWGEEGDEVTTGKLTTNKHLMKPRRLSVSAAFSVDLVNQASVDVDAMVMGELVAAHAIGLESAAVDGDGVKAPLGLLNNSKVGIVVGGVNGSAPSFKSMVDMETVIAAKDADLGNLAYLVNAKGRGALKTTPKFEGGERGIMESNEVNGYKVFASNILPDDLSKGSSTGLSAAAFGNWSDMIIGQWGGIDIIVDPYSRKKFAEIEVVLHSYHDIALRNDDSFSVCKDIITE